MGDIIRKVKLCGLTQEGSLKRDWRKCPAVNALVDTGATATVVTRSLAERAGATIMPGVKRWRGNPQDGALMALRLDAPDCGPDAHVVVINDDLAASAGPDAEMILGHDYLQGNRVRINYGDVAPVKCPARRKSRKP